ncbi:MAG: hypothetical protein AB7E29_03895 [Xanthobacter sp.]
MTARFSLRSARTLPAGLFALLLLGGPMSGQALAQGADVLASVLKDRISDQMVTRRISLAEMGMDEPVVFQGMDMRREIYLPVPAGVPLQDASIVVDGDYLRGDGGRTTAVFSVDGAPQVARNLQGDQGVVDLTFPVNGKPRPSGFVRFGVSWASVISEVLCGDERAIGNVLKLWPNSHFTYSYDASHVRDISTAWSAMPGRGSLLVPHGTLSKAGFDTAWRVGLALELSGKKLVVKRLPAVGDSVDLSGLDVPFGLRTVEPFSRLVDAGSAYQIGSEAEVGALLMLPGSPFAADMAVVDQNLMDQVSTALDALGARMGDASPLFQEWRNKAASLGSAQIGANELSLQTLAGRPMIAVGSDAGAKASALFDSFWRGIVSGTSVTVDAVETLPVNRTRLPLSDFGSAGGNLDVVSRGDWVVNFDLAAATGGQSLPSRLNVDVSAAPGASTSAPVVSLFLNDVLLAARQMKANGAPEELSAAIPAYALAATNTVRVSFQRQPVSDRCRETPQAFPAAVLPTSTLELGGKVSSADFLGVISGMGEGAHLVIPESYLATPRESVVRVVRAAAAAGVSAGHATLDVEANGAAFPASGNFLAMDVPVENVALKARVEGDRLIIGTNEERRILDISGLKDIAVAQAVHAGSNRGIIWQSVGHVAMVPQKPVRLSRGDVALIGPDGVQVEMFANGAEPGEVRVAEPDSFAGTLQRLWQNSASWGLPVGVAVAALFFLLLVRAAIVRRRGR